MATVKLTIDDREVEAEKGQTILEAAAEAGIEIPNLCHDPRLTPTGACRLCLVEIEGQRGLHTSCTRVVAPGMVVRTETPEIVEARRDVLELMLSEHRVSCTSCDKTGECKLLEYAYRYGADERRYGAYDPPERGWIYTDGNKAIEYDPDKCIRCQRCVKICAEVVMAEALTLKSRAMDVEVSTAFDVELNETTCVLCGSCVSACPSGAMYERPAKGQGQCQDLVKVRTTCTYCGVGCQLDLNVNPETDRIVRVTSEPGCIPNDGNLCVKGRFAFQFAHSPERLTTPLIKKNGSFREASWDEALTLVGERLTSIRNEHGADGVAFLSSSRCTNEENYLMQKLARAAGRTNNIDQCATT